jgi:hypothetical protein
MTSTNGIKIAEGNLSPAHLIWIVPPLEYSTSRINIHHNSLRAALHYSGEGHRSVKNFNPRHGYLRQGMVCRRRCKDNKKMS